MRGRLSLVGGLFLVLFVALILLPPTNERQVPLTVYSAEPGGGKALRLWLEALGHPATTLEGGRYAIGRDVKVVLLLAPTQRISSEVVDELERWTRQGGRLVVATDSILTRDLLRRFGVSTRVTDRIVSAVPAEAGLLDPAIQSIAIDTRLALSLDEEDAAGAEPLLLGKQVGQPARPTLFSQGRGDTGMSAQPIFAPRSGSAQPIFAPRSGSAQPIFAPRSGSAQPIFAPRRGHGRHDGRTPESDAPIVAARVPADRGELIVLTDPSVLSNEGLRTEASARLALSLVGPDRRVPVAFDELHHGFGTLQQRSLFELLLDQAWGRATFLAGGVVLLFLLWRGRRFGRAVPVFVDRGRSLGELVTSQAGLYRAGGKRAFVAEHLARELRHDLGQVVGLPAEATDAEIETRARAIGRDPTRALQALTRTRQARSDRELLAITREGERARAELAGTTSPTGRTQ